jgi:hypothetical protein
MSFQDRTTHQINQIDKEVCPSVTCDICITYVQLLHCTSHLKLKTILTFPTIQLSKYPMLNNLEKQTSIPKVYAFLGLVGIYFFLIFFNIAGEFLVNFAGFLIPGYFSLEALFSASKVDDTQV